MYLTLSRFADMMETAYKELAPHKICQYIYELSESFNHFYHETKILLEEDEKGKASYIKLLSLVQKFWNLVSICLDLSHRTRCKRKGVMVVFIAAKKNWQC